MDGPQTIEVQWKDSFVKVGLLVGAVAVGGVIYYLKIYKPKKVREEKQRAPDLDWYKSEIRGFGVPVQARMKEMASQSRIVIHSGADPRSTICAIKRANKDATSTSLQSEANRS